MKPQQRWAILGSLLAATLLAGYLIDDEPAPDNTPRKRTAASAGQRTVATARQGADKTELAAAPLLFPEAPQKTGEGEGAADDERPPVVDPFRAKSWYVAPPPPPPPKPTAPPLPFQYLGKVVEDGEVRVFLNQQGRHIVVKEGDEINGVYRVEQIAGGQMTLMYQPLKQTQMLAIGADK